MKILGIGNAIVDVICKIDENFIKQNNLTKGTMKLIFDQDEFNKILSGLKIELLATDSDGKEHVLGPELPGLDKINPKEKIRYHYTFLRMFQNPENETFRKSYIESLTNIIDQKNSEIVSFSIRLHQNFINKIQDIQKGSEISKTIIQTFGPYTLYKKL